MFSTLTRRRPLRSTQHWISSYCCPKHTSAARLRWRSTKWKERCVQTQAATAVTASDETEQRLQTISTHRQRNSRIDTDHFHRLYTSKIRNCVRRNNNWVAPFGILDDMQRVHNLSPDRIHLTTAMDVCVKLRRYDATLLLFDSWRGEKKKNSSESLLTRHRKINAIAMEDIHNEEDNWKRAVEICQTIQCTEAPDMLSFTVALTACDKLGSWETAVELLHDMNEVYTVQPDLLTYCQVMSACGRAGVWEKAVELLREMETRGIEPERKGYTAAIIACKRSGQWIKAIEFLREMESQGIQPDIICYNASISACAKDQQWELAHKMLREMESRGIAPDIVSYNSAINVCEKSKQWQAAVALFQEMKSRNITPDAVSYTSVTLACEKCGQDQLYIELQREMYSRRIYPDYCR